jgi:DNA primase
MVVDPLPEDGHFRNRVSIPYITRGGVVGIKYRCIDGTSNSKYKSNEGFYAKRVFNPLSLDSIHRKVYICEGEIDAITLAQLGIPAVAVPGVHNWDPRSAALFRNRRVIIPADGDDNGQGREFAERLGRDIEVCNFVVIQDGDVNSLFVKEGAEKLMAVIGWEPRK